MDATNMLALSFYKEIKNINNNKHVFLVSHVETGMLYVKKIYKNYNLQVFQKIKELNIPCIPKYELLVENKSDGTLTVIEEYINGSNLKTYMDLRDHPLSPEKAGKIVSNLAMTLERLHTQNPPIIHRDIKPSNVLIDANEKVYLIDFNISRNVDFSKNEDTSILGTQGYAAPEQYGFMQCTQKSDIYSLGVLLHFLTSKSPKSPQNASGLLAPIIKKATAIDPTNRYNSTKELFFDILNTLNTISYPAKNTASSVAKPKEPLPVVSKTPFITAWKEYKEKIKEPLCMSLKHKFIFSVAAILTGYIFYFSFENTTASVFQLVASILSSVVLVVSPFFFAYYIRKKQLRLGNSRFLNIVLHILLSCIIIAVLVYTILFIFIILESIFI